MDRIDGSTATPERLFTEGSPTGGVPATVVTDDWLNDVQEELITVLVAGGQTPTKGVRDQLLAAIRSIAGTLAQATETVLGGVKIATQALTDARTNDATAVTPKKLGNGFLVNLGADGFIKLPTWMGGWMFQWCAFTGASGTTVSFPTAFPTGTLKAMVSGTGSTNPKCSTGVAGATTLVIYHDAAGSATINVYVIGR